ncbi:MAG: hypothetical protein ACI379_16060 [Nocardioides sp.]|uniref:hypothetical protein n=1 Tax=Nocardioides sp. TaxID=35761 RepID=UPI003F02BB8C
MPGTERPRRSLTSAWAAAVVAVPFAVGASTVAQAEPSGEVAFSFADPEIAESSGLAVVGDHVVTTNDSGDAARVFTVDPGTGRTVGVTTWGEAAVDVEALGPAGDGHVWVADTGDNRRVRDEVLVARVPVGEGDRTVDAPTYRLRLPEGPQDVEALLVHPTNGRLALVTKSIFSGKVLLAPQRLRRDRVNDLTEIGSVTGLVTDGAFLADGRHLVVRTYTDAVVYSYPELEQVERWSLPGQRQGEAVAADGDTLLLSSEGVHTEVLRVAVPRVVAARTAVADAVELLRLTLHPFG